MNKFKTKSFYWVMGSILFKNRDLINRVIDVLCFIIGPILITYDFFYFLIVYLRLVIVGEPGLYRAYINAVMEVGGYVSINPYIPISLITVGVALVCWGFLRHYWEKNNLKDKLGGIRTGVDPTILCDLAIRAAHHIESGVRDFAEFSNKMIGELGEKVKPYLQGGWDTGQELLKNALILQTEEELKIELKQKAHEEPVEKPKEVIEGAKKKE